VGALRNAMVYVTTADRRRCPKANIIIIGVGLACSMMKGKNWDGLLKS
jgi:hypothetical protein